MIPEIYIIGTSHDIQFGIDSDRETVEQFKTEVERICETHRIQQIFEECSRDALFDRDVATTVCQSNSKEVPVTFIDPGNEERRSISLSDRDVVSFLINSDVRNADEFRGEFLRIAGEARERIWIGRILKHNEFPALLVCGAEHTKSVARLFRRLELECEIVYDDFGS